MTLIRCYQCNKKISPDAVACPKCGAPQQGEIAEKKKEGKRKADQTAGWVGLGCGVIALIIVGSCIAHFSGQASSPSPPRRPLSEVSTEELKRDESKLDDYTTDELLDEIDRIDRKHGW